MAKAPRKVKPKEEPKLPEKEPLLPEVEEEPKTYQVELIGKHLHTVGINGTVHQYPGGQPLIVGENIYRILKDAGLIGKEL